MRFLSTVITFYFLWIFVIYCLIEAYMQSVVTDIAKILF